jgi:signal transduction histidine kinase/DNA-binding response OmpR family regulator
MGQNHALKTSDGKLLFTCFQGFASVNPDKLPFNAQAPPLAIEQVSLNGRRNVAADAHVPVNRGEAEIHYAALSYLAPERVDYKYQLEGYDADWVSAGTRRVAYYTNLPPGPYRFRVIACNNDGVWNEQGATFGFYLEPRFYQTRWFGLLCVIGAFGLMAGTYRMRIRQTRRREQELAGLVAERTAELQQQSRELQEQSEELQQEIVWRKLAQEAAQLAKEVAESATRSKGEFLANMSHEIRTPLNGVLGMLELATHTSPTPEQAELLTIARDSATSLLVVLNDILDFSKIEAGKLAFESVPFHLSDTVTEAARSVAIRAHEKGLELTCEVAADVPMMVTGDSARLKQVLLNLLGNAVKFTPHGEIFLRVEREPGELADAGQAKLKFSVSDTGIGIPKEKQKLIFEAFAQEDTSTTRKFGGTGLGLTICSRIVNLMGGEIWVESEPGAGSTFRFTAKLPIAEAKAPDPAVVSELTGVRVLIVDDNATNRRILESMLAGYGLIVACAESGKAGIEAIRHAADAGTPFRLALVDYQMPGMNGFQFVELAAEMLGPTPTMMMLTSDDYNVTSQRCRQMGLPSYLIKPIKQSELIAAVRVALRPEAPHRSEPIHGPEEAGAKLNILLAEDNVVNQKVAIRMLERAGHKVLLANNGREALEALHRQDFDLVLMDIQMPEMDGLEAAAAIRQEERRTGERVPIVAMTAHAMSGDRERILAAGMDDYLSKPIDIKCLMETIQRVAANRSLAPISK